MKMDTAFLGVIGTAGLAFMAGRYLPEMISRRWRDSAFFGIFVLVALSRGLVRVEPFEVRWAPAIVLWLVLFFVHSVAWFFGAGEIA